MPYQDDRNGRIYRDRRGLGAGSIFAIILALVLIGGGIYWGLSGRTMTASSNSPGTTSSAPSTTGQGSISSPVNPGAQQNVPNPGTAPK